MGCICKFFKFGLFTTHLITNFSLCAKHRKGTVLRSGAEQIPPEQPQPQQQPLYHQPPVQPPPPQGENLYQFYFFLLKGLMKNDFLWRLLKNVSQIYCFPLKLQNL